MVTYGSSPWGGSGSMVAVRRRPVRGAEASVELELELEFELEELELEELELEELELEELELEELELEELELEELELEELELDEAILASRMDLGIPVCIPWMKIRIARSWSSANSMAPPSVISLMTVLGVVSFSRSLMTF